MKKIYLLFFLSFINFFQAQIVNIPDANFKAKLLSSTYPVASTQTPDNNGNVITYNAIDTNGDGEIQVSEASLIKYLNVCCSEILSLEGILSFSNLESLNCSGNQINTLDVSGLNNLRHLFCAGSQLSLLNLSGLSNLKSLSCINNSLTSLDVSSLTNLSSLSCSNNSLTTLNLVGLININYINCQFNQISSLVLDNNLYYLQFLNCYNNQLTSLTLNNIPHLAKIECQNNLLTSLNLNNLPLLQILYSQNNLLSNLVLVDLPSLESVNCSNNLLNNLEVENLPSLEGIRCYNNSLTELDVSDLSSLFFLFCNDNQLTTLFLKNGIYLSSLLNFNNNPNLEYICADDFNVELVQSKINTYGYSATCHVNSYCSSTPSGTYYTIQGNNKLDNNSNGCDELDGFYPNLKFSITDGTNSGTLIANASGNYSISVQAGTHTITPQFENPTYFTSIPSSLTVSFPATASPFVQDFCITPNGIHHDFEVVILPIIPARPGINATYKIKYKNKGNLIETATLVFNFDDAVLDYVSSTLTPATAITGSLSWNIGSIIPFQSGEFEVTLNVNSPMETPAVNGGDILSYSAIINGLFTDETPIDNTANLNQTVVNAYDPNDKTCLEGTTINPTMIGEYVHYQIRFENTGTYSAENIVVKDMIDTTKFDISTLQITDTSHGCVTRITNPNKVEFIFENINLPFDDATNDGYVVFKIKTKPTLTVGSTISNLANIYFDYNFPIVTNTATSTFQTLASNQFNLDNYISLSPNPAKDILNINVQDEANIKSIAIYNMLGQLVQIITNPTNSINISDLKTGNYIIKLHTEKGEVCKKFIKE
ncbi:T9SS type A sorting domain-containing protein [Flavobacterium sp.]|uniref:T9SS type A sorting domain-containing protein n=1 Tax=Flavobacterium sp. TaxID=239 RepID=UPI00261D27A4|nr:T9SS type A sorting domain-containing protein [Flavobacterium sp.]